MKINIEGIKEAPLKEIREVMASIFGEYQGAIQILNNNRTKVDGLWIRLDAKSRVYVLSVSVREGQENGNISCFEYDKATERKRTLDPIEVVSKKLRPFLQRGLVKTKYQFLVNKLKEDLNKLHQTHTGEDRFIWLKEKTKAELQTYMVKQLNILPGETWLEGRGGVYNHYIEQESMAICMQVDNTTIYEETITYCNRLEGLSEWRMTNSVSSGLRNMKTGNWSQPEQLLKNKKSQNNCYLDRRNKNDIWLIEWKKIVSRLRLEAKAEIHLTREAIAIFDDLAFDNYIRHNQLNCHTSPKPHVIKDLKYGLRLIEIIRQNFILKDEYLFKYDTPWMATRITPGTFGYLTHAKNIDVIINNPESNSYDSKKGLVNVAYTTDEGYNFSTELQDFIRGVEAYLSIAPELEKNNFKFREGCVHVESPNEGCQVPTDEPNKEADEKEGLRSWDRIW
ncbi:MAG: hypothetical protein JKX79_10465 [Labilibaculum sp.]|nr:hypothetical protein [Labilibaculum sp.]